MRYLPFFLLLTGCLAKVEATTARTEATTARTECKVDQVLDLLSLPDESAEPVPQLSVAELIKPITPAGGWHDAADPAPTAVPASTPLAPPASVPASGPLITFHGEPIKVADWLNQPVPVVEISSLLDVDEHLRFHGLDGDFSGLSRAEKIKLHSVAHAKEPAKSKVVTKSAAVSVQPNCPNGNCPLPAYQWSYIRTRSRRR